MTTRPLIDSDIPALREMARCQGYGYEFPDLRGPLMEAVQVVVDDDGTILMACAAEKLAQLYLFSTSFPPAAKLHAITLLHAALAEDLRPKGYSSVNAFLPPEIERSFFRRLKKSFGWFASPWKCIGLHF